MARDCLRVDRLITFGDYLCGIEPPMLSYNITTNQYVSIAPDFLPSEEEKKPTVHNTSTVSENNCGGASGPEFLSAPGAARFEQLWICFDSRRTIWTSLWRARKKWAT